jgi:uroporphyrin-III C-methyltransferase/precorrin-2 dehydrogenase/sirohydrochlorin ferrochelatase
MAHEPFIAALSLSGRPCLVAGSSEETPVRVQALLRAGAQVTLVAARLPAELTALQEQGRLRWLARSFEPSDLDGQWLAILVEQNAELAQRIADAANERRVYFCAVDQPEWCSFSHLSQARAADLIVAVSTAGQIPALAARLREELQRVLDDSDMAGFFVKLAALRRELPVARRRDVLQRTLSALRFSGKLLLPDLGHDA